MRATASQQRRRPIGGSATRITWCAQSLSGTLSVSPRGGVNEHRRGDRRDEHKRPLLDARALIFFQVAGRSISVPCVTPPKHGLGRIAARLLIWMPGKCAPPGRGADCVIGRP